MINRAQSCLNSLMLLSTCQEELDNINMKELEQYFNNKNYDPISMSGH